MVNLTRKKARKMMGGETAVPLCIYSHSDYFDVLEIQIHYLTELFKDTEQKIYIFTNEPYTKITSLKYIPVIYDEGLVYTNRILFCIKKLTEPYFIISHENDVLLNYHGDTILKLVDKMKESGIDSINFTHLTHHGSNEKEIRVTDTLSIWTDANNIYTFNVQPRLWRNESAIRFFSEINPKNYRTSENNNIQIYMKNKMKTYWLHSTKVPKDTIYNVAPEYLYIHVTKSLMFLKPPKVNANPNLRKKHSNMFNKWVRGKTRVIHP
jgi:GTP:adenosylcobinamide-phosphate guanylyltransferase